MAMTLSRARAGLAIALASCTPQRVSKPAHKGFTLIELIIVVAIIGLLAAIAVPNFLKFQARSKQSEAKANLKAIFTAQRAFFQENDRFSSMTGEVGFEAERNNRYAYFLFPTGTLEDRSTSTIAPASTYTGIQVDLFKFGSLTSQTYAATACGSAAGVVSAAPSSFVATAQGNVDGDATIDQWSISSRTRQFTPGGTCTADPNNPAGEPANDQNDANL